MAINFYFEQPATLRKRTALKKFIESLFKKEGKNLETLNYIFCSDKFLLQINKDYLKHNFYTDIITFDLSETKTAPCIGEIYISIDRVKENARLFRLPVTQELHRVIFHGALHLCGYKDKSTRQKREMRNKEDECLANYLFI